MESPFVVYLDDEEFEALLRAQTEPQVCTPSIIEGAALLKRLYGKKDEDGS